MFSKGKQRIKNNSEMDYDYEFINSQENRSSDEITHTFSLAEEVFTQLPVCPEGFNPRFFTNKDVANLCVTSKPLRIALSNELHQREAQKLLKHVVLGEQDEANMMIATNPQLLLIRTEAIDYSTRVIRGTAFQAALGAGDEPMWEMRLPYFEHLKPGEALRQFNEQFPTGIEDPPAPELRGYYNALVVAIIQDEGDGLAIVQRFRKEITSSKKITQGKHFNLQHLIAAYQAYEENIYDLQDLGKADFFWQKVIGYAQRQITTYDAQIHCFGVENALRNKNQFKRTLELSKGGKWFPLSHDDTGLGFEFAYDNYRGDQAFRATSKDFQFPVIPFSVKKYVKEKLRALARLKESLSKGCITSSNINFYWDQPH